MSVDPTRIDLATDPTTRRLSGRALHGNTPFDVPYISWITTNLYTGGCTDGLVLPKNIVHLISLYPWESYAVTHELRTRIEVRAYDSADEIPPMFEALAVLADKCIADGPTLIHCQAGLNRSGLLAAMVLMRRGLSARVAIDLLRAKRSPAVLCNRLFEAYLLSGGQT